MALYHHVENCVSVYKHNEILWVVGQKFYRWDKTWARSERLGEPVLDIQVNIPEDMEFLHSGFK